MEEKYIVKINKLDHFGRGISRIENIPVFVVNALVDEEVEIRIINKKKSYMEANVVKYIKTSSKRIKGLCPYYNVCGGCNIMHMAYSDQLVYKENKIKEIMLKFLNYDNIKPIIKCNDLNYRNKITLQVNDKIGYFKQKSYDIVEINECIIADNNINVVIKQLKKINLKNIKQIVVRTTKKETMLVFYIKDTIIEKEILNNFKDVDTIILINDKEKVIKGSGYITENINYLKYVISATSFFQVNRVGMENLYNKVLEYGQFNQNDKVLDLYCGTGTIGIYISKYCKEVLGIEINKEAIKDAFENKKINEIKNIDFKSGDVKDVLNKSNFKPNIIIVDPPRNGLDSGTIKHLLNLKSNKIIYVSCDPITLARDLNILKDKYNIVEITPFDMFVHTYHVECVVLLTWKEF
ncbi:MAG: 23S rRNA (uracil(1939)-C(5))-methyltransferase RlmD [Bacilli bacterium]